MRLVVLTRSEPSQGRDARSIATAVPVKRSLASTPEPHSSLDQFVETVRIRTDAIGAAVALRVGGELRCCGTAGNAPAKGTIVSLENTLAGECVRTGRVIRRDDLAKKNIAVLLAPIASRNGVVGVLALFWQGPATSSGGIHDMVRAATATLAAAVEATTGAVAAYIQHPQLTHRSEQASASRRLYGLPCDKCGSYYYSDEPSCPVCKGSGAENGLPQA